MLLDIVLIELFIILLYLWTFIIILIKVLYYHLHSLLIELWLSSIKLYETLSFTKVLCDDTLEIYVLILYIYDCIHVRPLWWFRVSIIKSIVSHSPWLYSRIPSMMVPCSNYSCRTMNECNHLLPLFWWFSVPFILFPDLMFFYY